MQSRKGPAKVKEKGRTFHVISHNKYETVRTGSFLSHAFAPSYSRDYIVIVVAIFVGLI